MADLSSTTPDTLVPTGQQAMFPGLFDYAETGWAAVAPDEVVTLYHRGKFDTDGLIMQGDSPAGQQLFLTSTSTLGLSPPVIAGDPGAGFVVLEDQGPPNPGAPVTAQLSYAAFDTSGASLTSGFQVLGPITDAITSYQAFTGPAGYHLEWVTVTGGASTLWQADLTGSGQLVAGSLIQAPGAAILPYAGAQIGGQAFTVMDNQAQLAGAAAVTLPGEPAAAITQEAAAALASGTTAAVGWIDSGTVYASVFDAGADSFGPRMAIDWGGASDLHLLALPDGGFVESWQKDGQYWAETFAAAGGHATPVPIGGAVAGIDSQGDLYTVGVDFGNETIQTYAISGSGASSSTVHTDASPYVVPAGVTTVYLTGSNQMVHANDAGDTIFSNDTGNAIVGGAGNDIFNLGRGGDRVAGGGGDDTYAFAAIPWAGGHITDFNAGDALDLTGLMSTTSDTGTDGFADGYLKLTDDGSGDAQVWADYHIPGNDGWWLVETLDGVSSSSLTHSGDVIAVSGSSSGGGTADVSTADPSYVAPASVKSITLTGSQQHIDASATSGVAINSNDTGNVLIGGPGDDVFHLGRGGDWATGGAGADTFAYAAIPWSGGGVTDFNAAEGDRVDVSGLLSQAGYTGTDPFADGYLKFATDSSGNAQLLADYNQPGNNSWWLVATLDGVSTSSLHYSGGMIT
ncbi:MAG TPA: type I secretion C-terminal target domain-containing protein [Caulobacteraceae bacterium]|jgi:hypothetical protein